MPEPIFDISALERELRAFVAAIVREEVAAVRRDLAVRPAALLSIRQASEYAQLSAGTLRRWIREGRLEARRAGRVLRVERKKLETALKPREYELAESPEALARRLFG